MFDQQALNGACSDEIIVLDEIGSFSDEIGGILDAFAIFQETVCAKNAVAARIIAIGDLWLSLSWPTNDECSRIGLWRMSRVGWEAPRRPHPPRLLVYEVGSYEADSHETDSRILQTAQSPICNIPTPPGAMTKSIISPLPITPEDSISSQLLKPQVASSSAEAPQLSSNSTTQASNQTDPATTNVSHDQSALMTGMTSQVAISARTEPSQKDSSHLSAKMTAASMHPSGAINPSSLHITATKRTGTPSCTSQNFAPVAEVGPSAPTSAPVITTPKRTSPTPTGASATCTLSKPVSSSSPLDAMSTPKNEVHPPSGTAPVPVSSASSGPHSNLSSPMVPSAVACVTAQGAIPSRGHPTPFAFQSQSQTGAQVLSSTSRGGGSLGSNAAPSSGITRSNPFSNFQPPPSSFPAMAGQPVPFMSPPSNTPVSMQQGPSNSRYQNPFGPPPPLVALPAHPHPQSVSGQGWLGDRQGALRYSIPVTQFTSVNPASGRLLSDPAGFSVNQGDTKTVSITQEQFHAAQATFKELRKAHEEAASARSKAMEELESERKRSEELSRRLGDAEKVVGQMRREQENSGIQHREELDRARKANTEQMKAVVETINEEWALKLRGNEERLVREVEQAKRQAVEERELSATREEELRSRLKDLEVQSDWKSKLEALEGERLKLQQELVDLNQAFLRADADAQVDLSRQQELERQLDDSWARERARPELVKAFLLLEDMAQKVKGPCDVLVTGSAGPDMAQNPVKVGDSPESPVRVEAKRRRLQ